MVVALSICSILWDFVVDVVVSLMNDKNLVCTFVEIAY